MSKLCETNRDHRDRLASVPKVLARLGRGTRARYLRRDAAATWHPSRESRTCRKRLGGFDERLDVAAHLHPRGTGLEEITEFEGSSLAPVLTDFLFLLVNAIVKLGGIDPLKANLSVRIRRPLTHHDVIRDRLPSLSLRVVIQAKSKARVTLPSNTNEDFGST